MSNGRLDQGVFVFSWDFELAWGFHDNQSLPDRLHKYDSRAYIEELINILERNRIPTTWATVGHLLLEECTQTGSRPHDDLPAPIEGWYDCDPCSTVQLDPLWYAPDIIEDLRSCKVNQEIASHTFSHVTTNVDEEILTAELKACRNLANDGEMRTFVSPRHGTVPSSVLLNTGYTSYRVPSVTPSWRQALSFYSGIGGPKTSVPTRGTSDIWRHPMGTYFFYQPLNKIQCRFPQLKRRWFETGIQHAISNNEVFHVWAHPHNFFGDERAIKQFNWLICRVADLRDIGLIKPMTLRQLTDYMSDTNRDDH